MTARVARMSDWGRARLKDSERILYCDHVEHDGVGLFPERQEFMRDYVAGRFVTIDLLDHAWEECRVPNGTKPGPRY